MGFNYDPRDAVECLPEGEYDAELTSVTEKTSQAGNDMLEVTWTIMKDGRTWPVRDYIVQPSTLFKLKGIARAWGLLDEFDNRTFQLGEHLRRLIRLTLKIQKSDDYPDRNQVGGYKPASGDAQPVVEEPDTMIPF